MIPDWRSSDGANAVEFALVLPILVILLFGMLTGGISLNRWLQMNHAAREGVRYAATLPASEANWFDDVVLRTYAAAAGELTFVDSTVEICVSRQVDASTIESLTVPGGLGFSSGDDPAVYIATHGVAGSAHCYADNLGTDGRVQVTAERQTRLQAVFFSTSPTLVSESVARYEDAS